MCCCRCASLGVRACILMPVDLEIAPLDLGSSGSGTFCSGWQAADLAAQHKTAVSRQPEDRASMLVSTVFLICSGACAHTWMLAATFTHAGMLSTEVLTVHKYSKEVTL